MFKKIRLGILAARELGFKQLWQFGMYQVGLRSGYYRLRTPSRQLPVEQVPTLKLALLPLPDPAELRRLLTGRIEEVINRADEVAAGKVRLFGGEAVPLELVPQDKTKHWTRSQVVQSDIKQIWEPARFGWVFDLGRAYLLSQDERYPEVFWQRWEEFQAGNPANLGPNWQSAQEVALRLIALFWAARLFWTSVHSTADRKAQLAASLVDHARRIPVTLAYARAQNNNHLVSEAVGLYVAGVLMADFPEAPSWKQLGWEWLNRALQSQIEDDGEYIQHSTNYHRLVLQLALLVNTLSKSTGQFLPSATAERLGAATRWLLGHFDPQSGGVSNLGHNDGANPLPLSFADYKDYRPVIQAASLAFLGRPALPAGAWDEYPLWLGMAQGLHTAMRSGSDWRIDRMDEWATLRARRYTSRPAHADQLQVDLWYHGQNILLDPGTYSYNRLAPWDNGLADSAVHNAITIDWQEPMLRAGRFLWLDWAQGYLDRDDCVENTRISAYHDGYARLGLRHQRSLEWLGQGSWKVTDKIFSDHPTLPVNHMAVLHWLLPDGEHDLQENGLRLTLSGLRVTISVQWSPEGVSAAWTRLVRAGKVLAGPVGDVERFGWFSPTYSVLVPAISFQVGLTCQQPVTISTTIQIDPVE